MRPPILERIPGDRFSDYRYEVIFKAYKWDPQVEDDGTVARHVVRLGEEAARALETWAEQLADETVRMEEALLQKPRLAKRLGLPGKIRGALGRISDYHREKHVRLMRFDFHPTTDGWKISEVNSDVPGGLAEASILPALAGRYFEGCAPRRHVGDSLLKAFAARIKPGGRIALVHATSYSDDRQVMQFLGDHFERAGYRALYAAPDHIRWEERQAVSVMEGREGPLDGIIRFFPLEWLVNLPRSAHWQGYYGGETPACNHPVAMLTQSKRLPLVWDELNLELPAWRALLPRTVDPRRVDGGRWIYKPALGRVGEGISIREAVSSKELARIEKMARRYPSDWVAQERFESVPLTAPDGESYHLCVGVFTVDGKCAGFYGRISPYPRIDAKAQDIPLLVERKGTGDEG